MTAIYTFDVFSSLDGFGSHKGDWGGYWGKQGRELLAFRSDALSGDQRLVLGATTYREFAEMRRTSAENPDVDDEWVRKMLDLPTTVISSTLKDPLELPNATVVAGDAVAIVRAMKEEAGTPIRSHGSLSLNRALMAAGLVDRVMVTMFPVITGRTGTNPVFENACDFDLELLRHQTFDDRTQVLTYRPILHS